jgi:Fe-S-cluster-containing hydrogenase component 2
MGRRLDPDGLPELLAAHREDPHWNEVAQRCLSCGNCTLVCPTCFCTTVVDATDVTGTVAERRRHWDSCFDLDFSYLHAGSVRASTSARYRHWISHKLGTWPEQFGTAGCVGCGRCITWCSVGIDITAEIAALRGGVPEGGGL